MLLNKEQVLMKRIITIIFLLFSTISYSADNENILISEIVADIDNYKNQVLTINLRLKYIDRIFEKIVFYDSENADIEFDISGKVKRKQLAGNLINIHEGMIYRVKFTAVGAGAIGGLTGDLHEFIPVIFDKIPEGGIN
jgi:hypothetical protein